MRTGAIDGMRRLFQLFCCAIFAISLVSAAHAEEGAEQEQPAPSPTPSVVPADPFLDIWGRVKRGLRQNDLRVVNDALLDLEGLKLTTGIESLERYSLVLLDRAEETRDREARAYFTRKALELSPRSPEVLLRSLGLVSETGLGSVGGQLVKLFTVSVESPRVYIGLLSKAAYPVLWALTFSFFFVTLALIFMNGKEILSRAALHLPKGARGFLVGPLLIGAFTVSLLAGPLGALAAAAAFLVCFCQRYRAVGCAAGFLIACWGFVLPIKENITLWHADTEIQSLLEVIEGSRSPGDKARLLSLQERRPQDAAVAFALADLYRQNGEYINAQKEIDRARNEFGEMPWLLAQSGLLAFIRGESESAKEMFEQAAAMGLSSASFHYNYSKILFDLVDTEGSKQQILLAQKADAERVKELEEREMQLGLRTSTALAPLHIPFSAIQRSVMIPYREAIPMANEKAQTLLYGSTPWTIALLGLFVIALSAAYPDRSSKRVPNYFSGYEAPSVIQMLIGAVPGGRFLLCGRAVLASLLITLVFLCIWPLVAWPLAVNQLFTAVPALFHISLFFAAALVAVLYYWGSLQDAEEV